MPKRRLSSADDADPIAGPPPRLLALRLLGRRDYTTQELLERLTDKGVPPDEAAATVTALAAEGLGDDRRAAAAHVRTASRVKGRGPRRIRLELEARGVRGADADEAMRELSPEETADVLKRLLARKAAGGLRSREDRDRLFRQLIRRGFSVTAIEKALKEP